jgi:hypothetical protein
LQIVRLLLAVLMMAVFGSSLGAPSLGIFGSSAVAATAAARLQLFDSEAAAQARCPADIVVCSVWLQSSRSMQLLAPLPGECDILDYSTVRR